MALMPGTVALSPIVLFVYNRPWHTQQTIEALQKNELASESELYIFRGIMGSASLVISNYTDCLREVVV